MSTGGYQSRYIAYAKAHGRTPRSMAAHDATRPIGAAAGYILWVRRRWREWCVLSGVEVGHTKTEDQHAAFDSWLASGGAP